MSNYDLINLGVLQGSAVTPKLFLSYINDLSASYKLYMYILFSDDTKLSASHVQPSRVTCAVEFRDDPCC